MIPITERLRARQEPVGDGTGKWRPDGLCQEAADVIDALVALVDEAVSSISRSGIGFDWYERADTALSRAKGKQE